eukprot:14555274-Ditylum_brightwellii.AAC.1
MLKKRQSANKYHHAREAVTANVVSMVFCPTKYNLVDMGTKTLNGMIQQFLLKNQTFPLPAETVGECKAKSSESVSEKGNVCMKICSCLAEALGSLRWI